jgi:hypothetical protein
MTSLKVGDEFPEGVKFTYIPTTPESSDINACGLPQQYDASKGTYSLPDPRSTWRSLERGLPSLTN